MIRKIFILYVMLIPILTGCINKNNSRSSTPLSIKRYDRVLYENDSAKAFSNEFIDATKAQTSLMSAFQGDSLTFNDIASSRPVKIFGADIIERLGDITEQEQKLSEIKNNLETTLPRVNLSNIYATVIPYRQSIVTVDSVILVGLNHYLGTDYPGYVGFDEYIIRTKVKERIPYDIAEAALVAQYPYETSAETTMINRMLYEGAILYVLSNTIKSDTDISQWLGYDETQSQYMKENEPHIWQKMAVDRMLFSTDEMLAAKLLNRGPSSQMFGPDTPPMVGRWIGYQIVKSYISRHKDTSFETLLTPEFYNNRYALIEAAYKS